MLDQGNQGANAALSQAVIPTDGVSKGGQEAEGVVAGGDGNLPPGSDVSGQSVQGDSQPGLRRMAGSTWPGGLSAASPAVTAFEAAKDIMEALRTKHGILAIELEVQSL